MPYLIDNDSGIGVDVLVEDLNGDGRLDVVSASKRGVSPFPEWRYSRPGQRDGVSRGRPYDDWAHSLSPRKPQLPWKCQRAFT